MARQVIICLLLFVLFAAPVNGCIGARYAALGWSGVAIADGPEASYWNPAALVWARDGFIFDNVSNRIALAVKQNSLGFYYVDEYDKLYSCFSYGRSISGNDAIGISIGLYSANENAWHSDYKGIWITPSFIHRQGNWSFGIQLQGCYNLRPALAYQNEYITIGISCYDILNLSSLKHYQWGMEIRPLKFLALRTGFNEWGYRTFTGIGLTFSNITIDLVHTDVLDNIYFGFVFNL